MNKKYRIMQFEQIINNIKVSIDIADEIELEIAKDRLENLLNGLEIMYNNFANSESSEVDKDE